MSNIRLLTVALAASLTLAAASSAALAQSDAPEQSEDPSAGADDSSADDASSPPDTPDEASEDEESETADPDDDEESGDADQPDQPAADAAEESADTPDSTTDAADESADAADEETTSDDGTTAGGDGTPDDPTDEDDATANRDDADDTGAGIVAVNSAGEGDVYVESNEGDNPPGWRLGISGYVRTLFTTIQNDPNVDFVGRHDGFDMLDARLKLDGQLANGLGFQFELDGAVKRTSGTVNSPVVDLVARLKDAYISYTPFGPLRVSAGQFKPPYDVEELTPNSELLFIHESVGSRGIRNVEGYNVAGLSLDRQVGLRLDAAQPWYPMADGDDPEGLGLSYALAATNGNPARRSLNDNDRLAYYGRGALHWADIVQLGGAYYLNDKSVGERPDRYGLRTTGWTADLTVDVAGVTAVASFLEQTDVPFDGDNEEGSVTSRAYQGQIAYEEPFLGFQPAYRYAYYDPSERYDGGAGDGGFSSDRRVHHTFALNYNADDYPLRLMLNYTLAREQQERTLTNDRFDALLQLTW